MDAQMKRGFLDACVLATLLAGESYGYQIIKDAPPSLGLSESTLYPLLKRLETRGLINVRKAEHNGRLRKYYSLTPDGRAAVRDFLEDQTEVLSLYRFVQNAALNSGKTQSNAGCATNGAPLRDTGGETHPSEAPEIRGIPSTHTPEQPTREPSSNIDTRNPDRASSAEKD